MTALIPVAGDRWFIADIFAQFSLQAAGAWVVVALLFFLGGSQVVAICALLLGLAAGAPAALYLTTHPPGQAGRNFADSEEQPAGHRPEGSFRVLSLNVYSRNTGIQAIRRVIGEVAPDLLLILELTDALDQHLDLRQDGLQKVISLARSDNFGIGLWSALPAAGARITFPDTDTGVPAVTASVDVQGNRVQICGIHPVPPGSQRGFQARNRVISAGMECARSSHLAVLTGDFNAAPWTPVMRRVVTPFLSDVRQGKGILATWPAESGFLRIPIDHIFTSSGLRVHRAATVRLPGSDHLGIWADLSPGGQPPSAAQAR